MSDPMIALTQPIKAHDETVESLTLRRPTGKDVRELGYPYKISADESVSLQADVIARYIERLAAIPRSSVDQMDPVDLNAAAWAVAGFFLGSAASPKN